MRHTPCGCIAPQIPHRLPFHAVGALIERPPPAPQRANRHDLHQNRRCQQAGRRGRRPLQGCTASVFGCRGRRPRRPEPRAAARVSICFAAKSKVPARALNERPYGVIRTLCRYRLAGSARRPCFARTQSLRRCAPAPFPQGSLWPVRSLGLPCVRGAGTA